MSRSLKKGPFVDAKLYTKVQRQAQSGASEPIKTWARACTIVPEFVGVTFLVHNGRQHVPVLTAIVRPTISGNTMDRRDQVLIGRRSLVFAAAATFFAR